MCHTLGGKARRKRAAEDFAWNVQTLADLWSLIWRIRLGGFLPWNPLAGHDHVFWRHRFDQAAAGTSWHFKGEVYSQYFLIHGFVLDMYDSFHFNYLANNLKSSMGLYNFYQIALLGRSMLVLVWVVSTPIQNATFRTLGRWKPARSVSLAMQICWSGNFFSPRCGGKLTVGSFARHGEASSFTVWNRRIQVLDIF